jgi:hypothetical protein
MAKVMASPPVRDRVFSRQYAGGAAPEISLKSYFPEPKKYNAVARLLSRKKLRRAHRNESPELTSEVTPGPRLLSGHLAGRVSLRLDGSLQ